MAPPISLSYGLRSEKKNFREVGIEPSSTPLIGFRVRNWSKRKRKKVLTKQLFIVPLIYIYIPRFPNMQTATSLPREKRALSTSGHRGRQMPGSPPPPPDKTICSTKRFRPYSARLDWPVKQYTVSVHETHIGALEAVELQGQQQRRVSVVVHLVNPAGSRGRAGRNGRLQAIESPDGREHGLGLHDAPIQT